MLPNSDISPAYSALRTFGAKGPTQAYDRYHVQFQRTQLMAQVIVIPQGRARMTVHADHSALEVDFTRQQVTNPELVETYLPRPGFHLSQSLVDLMRSGSRAILFNGNNIGYWGNQYVIHKHKLRYKRRGPIFDDGDLLHHASNGYHCFFLATNAGFRIERLPLLGMRREGRALEALGVPGGSLPRYGLSGFPLVRHGRSVWKEYGPLAWDPGLLFDLGRIPGQSSATELRDHVAELLNSDAPLARHPMTVIGIDVQDQVVLMVVERSANSRGMTVAEAAGLLRRRFHVQDAIVLGAAGDAQLATTEEGFLTEPLVASYAKPSSRQIPDELLHSRLRGRPVWARPVPCYVQFDLVTADTPRRSYPSAEPLGMA